MTRSDEAAIWPIGKKVMLLKKDGLHYDPIYITIRDQLTSSYDKEYLEIKPWTKTIEPMLLRKFLAKEVAFEPRHVEYEKKE